VFYEEVPIEKEYRMSDRHRIKPINDQYNYCTKCGMLQDNCLCECIKTIESPVEFWLLTTEKEQYRPSNTGRLLEMVMPNATRSFVWQRHLEPADLMALIDGDIYDLYLLFPTDEAPTYATQIQENPILKKRAYILIDATWKEAKRILRLSPYLEGVPKVTFSEDVHSDYNFRRGAEKGQLCTYEAAVEVLKSIGEEGLAKVLKENFDLYLKAFNATIHGHQMKD